MKLTCFRFFVISLTFICINCNAQVSTFKIIREFPGVFGGDIDTMEIKKLDEPLKAVAALYSAMAGTSQTANVFFITMTTSRKKELIQCIVFFKIPISLFP